VSRFRRQHAACRRHFRGLRVPSWSRPPRPRTPGRIGPIRCGPSPSATPRCASASTRWPGA